MTPPWPSGGGIRARVRSGWSWSRLRPQIYTRDGGRCRRCGVAVRRDAYQVDHVLPLSRGGAATDHDNLVTLCLDCHRAKTNTEKNQGRRSVKRAPTPHPGRIR